MSPYLIVAPWIVFGAYWVINAWSVKATAERQSLASALPNRCLTLAGGILLFWRSQPHPFETRIIPNTMTAGCSGLGLCLLGLALAIWSRNTLGRNWSSVVTLKKEHELVERGPYRFVRHPIYSAILLMSTGTAVAFGRLGCWLGVPFLFWGFWQKLRQEEALLTAEFPGRIPRLHEAGKGTRALCVHVVGGPLRLGTGHSEVGRRDPARSDRNANGDGARLGIRARRHIFHTGVQWRRLWERDC